MISRSRSITRLLISAVCLILFCQSSHAEDKAEANQKNQDLSFNPEVFSISKKRESAFDSPSAIYILSGEDIRRSGITSIPEALRLAPGVQVARLNGNSWAIGIRGFDRQFSNKVLVMIDGRVIYTYLFSGVAWDTQDYVMEDIDRIEIARGPGTVWGANAVDGVINIITKSAAQTQGTYISQIVGSQDKSITEARYGGKTASNDDYRLYVKKAIRDGVDRSDNHGSNHDGTRQDRAGFRYDMSSIKNNSLSFHGDIYSGVAENYFATFTNPGGNNKDSRGGNLMMSWDRKLSQKSNFTLNSYFDYEQFSTSFLQRSSRTFDIDFQHFYTMNDTNQLSWGLGYRQITDDSEEARAATFGVTPIIPINYSPDRRNDELYSAFLQDKITLVPDKLNLILGSKFLINDFTGFEYMPSARLAYYPTRNQTIWASISRAVRTPTRSEDGATVRNDASPYGIIAQGSNTYESEELMAYEAGYKVKPTRSTMIDISAFYNDYSKLKTSEAIGNANPLLATPTAANLGFGESYGAEITGKWQANDDWRLEANYDFTKMDLHISDNSTDAVTRIATAAALQVNEGTVPQSQFKLKSFYNIGSNYEFDNILYYVSGLPSAGANVQQKGIPSYFRFDTRFGYLPTRNLDLSIGVQNVLNQVHKEFSKALYNRSTEFGRTFYFKLVWQY
ncbi:MAG: TonB-dependent receptor [Pseudomonadota bacterium]